MCARFNKFYIDLIPRTKRDKLFESHSTIDKKSFQFVGSLNEAHAAKTLFLEVIGIKQTKLKEEDNERVGASKTSILSSASSSAAADNFSNSDIDQLQSEKKPITTDHSLSLSMGTSSQRLQKEKDDHPSEDSPEGDDSVPESSRYPGKAVQVVKDEAHKKPAAGDQAGVNQTSLQVTEQTSTLQDKAASGDHRDPETNSMDAYTSTKSQQ